MGRFWIVYMGAVIVVCFCLFYLGRKDYEVIKEGGKAKTWSAAGQEKFTRVVQWGFRLFAIAFLVLVLVPMTMDIPSLISKEYSEYSGHLDTVNVAPFGNWALYQSVHIGDEAIHYFGQLPIREETVYQLRYLPRSKFGISIEKINGD